MASILKSITTFITSTITKKPPEFVVSTSFQESDWSPLFESLYLAFSNTPEVTLLYPHGLDPAYRSEYAARFKAMHSGDGKRDRPVAKVMVKESSEIVAYIAGVIFRAENGMAEDRDLDLPPAKLPMIEDAEERAFYEWYWTVLRDELRSGVKETQVPNVYIQSLFTHPKWQRHGAASLLMKWILDLAIKEKDIGRSSLLATPVALKAGFYEKFGFRTVYVKKMADEKRYPGREGQLMTVMIREV